MTELFQYACPMCALLITERVVSPSGLKSCLPYFNCPKLGGACQRECHFYFLDQQSRIQSTKVAHCADDSAALEFARQLNVPADIEVWQRTRLGTRLNAEGNNVQESRRTLAHHGAKMHAPLTMTRKSGAWLDCIAGQSALFFTR
jgi:hypothetical protein